MSSAIVKLEPKNRRSGKPERVSEAIQVSMVENAYTTETKSVSLVTVLEQIEKGRWESLQDEIRKKREEKLRETDGDLDAAKKAIKKDKEALPGVLFAGSFSHRSNEGWEFPSGCMSVDIDNLNSDLPIIREKLRQSPHLFFDCESVTGSGLRAVVKIAIGTKPDEDVYHGCFEAMQQHVRELCGVEIDPACRDPARISFVCADRNARLNLEATPISPLPETPKPKHKTDAGPQRQGKPNKAQIREMLAVIPKRPDYCDWIEVIAAVGDALNDADAIEVLNEWSPEESRGEYAAKLKNRLRDVHIDTLIHRAQQQGWTGRPKISFRSPAEILSMPRNPKANFFGDYLLGIAQSLVIAGIGGLGKSRLLLQLLIAFILERIWCGIETHHTKDKPWMLIQTQNSIQRLQDDLEPLKAYAGDDWSLVEKNLLIHTLETDRDLMLHLSDQANARDLESAIRDYNPIGVAFDPLNEVAVGDLNKDTDMAATCNVIGQISRAGNPERAIIVATHALTGVAGIKKAFGFEAAGFGRNSKVLQFWSRAFVNVFPATEDYSVLGVTCGKNNNGEMFDPFAIRLSDTKIYELEPDFDMQALREQIESGTKKRTTYDPKIVAEMEWPAPEGGGPRGQLDKKQLAAALQEETNCSISTAYRLIDAAVVQRVIRFSKLTKIYSKK